MLLPAAFRSLSRPSSAPSAKAFTLRSSSVDLCAGINFLIPLAAPCTSVYMVHCLPAPSRAAMGGLSCLYQTFELMIGFLLRFRKTSILSSIRFPICCLRILHYDVYPVYVMSSRLLRIREAHASRGMCLCPFVRNRKRFRPKAKSTHHFEDTCVCSFQGTSMPFYKSRRPPALPHRLQCSTIGRPGLHRRVRHGNGCFPRPYRRQIFPASSLNNETHTQGFRSSLLLPSASTCPLERR